jgi:hypothetical protein
MIISKDYRGCMFGRTEAFALFQIMYLVHDPPDWSCENGETFSDILLSLLKLPSQQIKMHKRIKILEKPEWFTGSVIVL